MILLVYDIVSTFLYVLLIIYIVYSLIPIFG